MSGIWGCFINTNNSSSSFIKDFNRAYLWNKAYGNTIEDTYSKDNICLGCCIEKLSKNAPLSSPILESDSMIGVIDSVIYNRPSLIAQYNLSDSLSDEEIIFRIINNHGFNALSTINGDFAGAIYNSKSQEFTLFCDHIGIRQLYYYASDSFFFFSTDIRGILSVTDVDASVNPEWVYSNFRGYTFKDPSATEFKHICRIAPASYTSVKYNSSNPTVHPIVTTNKYWQIGSKKIRLSSFDAYKQKLYELTKDAVLIRADVTSETIGAELSGGLDSGVIDIILNRAGRKCIYHSWSIDPSEVDYVERDERLIIKDICEQEGISCHYFKRSRGIPTGSKMDQTLNSIGLYHTANEGPYIAYALLPHMNTVSLSSTAEYLSGQGCNIVFTGHGGDEGVSHRAHPFELYYHHEYLHYLRIMWSRTHGQRFRIIKTIKKCREDVASNKPLINQKYAAPMNAPQLLRQDFVDSVDDSFAATYNFSYDSIAYVSGSNTQNRPINTALYGAYNGVRYVFPYLDYRLIDFAVSIPRHLHINWKWHRLLFRETFKDIMPDSMYRLRTKEDFSRRGGRPVAANEDYDWFAEFKENLEYTLNLLDSDLWRQYIDMDKVHKLLTVERPNDSEKFKYNMMLYCLDNCTYVQSAVNKARSLPIE